MKGDSLKTSVDLIIKVANHLGTSLTIPPLVPCNVAMLPALIPSNIVMLLNHNTLESATPICLQTSISHYIATMIRFGSHNFHS